MPTPKTTRPALDPALALPEALPAYTDYVECAASLRALSSQIQALRAAWSMEMCARAFVDFPWVDRLDVGGPTQPNTNPSWSCVAVAPSGALGNLDDILAALDAVHDRRAWDQLHAPTSIGDQQAPGDLDLASLLDAILQTQDGQGFGPRLGGPSFPSARQNALAQDFEHLRENLTQDSLSRAHAAFAQALEELLLGAPSHAQTAFEEWREISRADAIGVALEFGLPDVAANIEAAQTRRVCSPATSSGPAPRL